MTRNPCLPEPTGVAASRRDVLRTASLVALSGGAVLTLAACGADGQAGAPVSTAAGPSAGATSEPSTPSASAAAPTSASPAPSKTASEPAPKAPDGPSVPTKDVPVGGGVILDDADYVVTQPSKGTYRAFSKTCTHRGCTVAEVSSDGIECHCHGSVFSIKDGSVVHPPATKALPESKTTVFGSKVYVAD